MRGGGGGCGCGKLQMGEDRVRVSTSRFYNTDLAGERSLVPVGCVPMRQAQAQAVNPQ